MAVIFFVGYHVKAVIQLFILTIALTVCVLFIFTSLEIEYSANDDSYFQFIPECSCWRPFAYPPHPHQPRIVSTCSDEASQYNSSQRIISFSFYPPYNSPLLDDIQQNLNLMKIHYPQFAMRVYTNVSLSESTSEICDLLCSDRNLQWCDIHKTPSHGSLVLTHPSTWRYIPIGDPSVEVFLPRELSTKITAREAFTVEDWISKNENGSRKAFQIIRDQPKYSKDDLGVLAVNNTILGKSRRKELQNYFIQQIKHDARTALRSKDSKQSSYKIQDRSSVQIIENIIFELPQSLVIYDSYHCIMWESPIEVRPIPVRRIVEDNQSTDFIGWNPLKGLPLLKHCPAECRPMFGKHWKLC